MNPLRFCVRRRYVSAPLFSPHPSLPLPPARHFLSSHWSPVRTWPSGREYNYRERYEWGGYRNSEWGSVRDKWLTMRSITRTSIYQGISACKLFSSSEFVIEIELMIRNILREDWKPVSSSPSSFLAEERLETRSWSQVLNLGGVMVGLQFLFLEPYVPLNLNLE